MINSDFTDAIQRGLGQQQQQFRVEQHWTEQARSYLSSAIMILENEASKAPIPIKKELDDLITRTKDLREALMPETGNDKEG